MFISFEGIDGCGKTTQARLLAEGLEKIGMYLVFTVEPGGSVIGSKIRNILLDPKHKELVPLAELLLYNADRAQHVEEVILPALKSGKVVITDRYIDSTIAYQGYGRGLDMGVLHTLENLVTRGLKPDITFLLDINVEQGLERNMLAGKIDRIQEEDIRFHEMVRQGYLKIGEANPWRFFKIDGGLAKDYIADKIFGIFLERVNGL
ncbi:MAG: dTMP kinase [Candidatus Magnetoovum sp. WYHC-5]|nr:dTMP kinase [Candidatus Magnetoovum sp. WYHC-5]